MISFKENGIVGVRNDGKEGGKLFMKYLVFFSYRIGCFYLW